MSGKHLDILVTFVRREDLALKCFCGFPNVPRLYSATFGLLAEDVTSILVSRASPQPKRFKATVID
jgi:hypothetical protein